MSSLPQRDDSQIIPFRNVPSNLEAELCVIGSMLLDNTVIDDLVTFLTPADFWRDTHQVLFRRIAEVRASGSPVDALILMDHLTRCGELGAAGGEESIRKALEETPSAANATYHGQIVKQRSISRSLMVASDETLGDIQSNLYTAEELAERAENRVYAISNASTSGMTSELSEAVSEAYRLFQRRSDGEVLGVSSGWRLLDEVLGGFQPGTLTVVGARPSMGKTALALNLCEHAVLRSGIVPFLVSLEMGRVEVANRLIQSVSRIEGHKLKHPCLLRDDDLGRLEEARHALMACNFPIDDTPSRTVAQVAANARRLRSRRGIGLMVVDYLQLIDGDSARESRQEQVAKISRRLKGIARELQIPVIALSQINRGVEGREDHRPRMADLRESGAIEQDADVVLLLHRPEYYDPNDQPGIAEVIVAKNRNGATETVQLVFHRQFARFDSLDTRYPI